MAPKKVIHSKKGTGIKKKLVSKKRAYGKKSGRKSRVNRKKTMKKKRKMTKKEMKGAGLNETYIPGEIGGAALVLGLTVGSVYLLAKGLIKGSTFVRGEVISGINNFRKKYRLTKPIKNPIYNDAQKNDLNKIKTIINTAREKYGKQISSKEDNKLREILKYINLLEKNITEDEKTSTEDVKNIKSNEKTEDEKNSKSNKKYKIIKVSKWKRYVVPILDQLQIPMKEREFKYEDKTLADVISEEERKKEEEEHNNIIAQAKAEEEREAEATPGSISGKVAAFCLCFEGSDPNKIMNLLKKAGINSELREERNAENKSVNNQVARQKAEKKRNNPPTPEEREQLAQNAQAEAARLAAEKEEQERLEYQEELYAQVRKVVEQLDRTNVLDKNKKEETIKRANRRASIVDIEEITEEDVKQISNQNAKEFDEEQYNKMINILNDLVKEPVPEKYLNKMGEENKDKYKEAFQTIKDAMEQFNNSNPDKLNTLIRLIEDYNILTLIHLNSTEKVVKEAKKLSADPVYDFGNIGAPEQENENPDGTNLAAAANKPGPGAKTAAKPGAKPGTAAGAKPGTGTGAGAGA